MATLVDLYNNTLEEATSIFNSIQKRYLDPYTVRLSTESEQYRFVETEINKITSIVYGDNVVVNGFEVTNIDTTENYIDIYINKGTVVADSTIIEFTDDIILRIPKTQIDLTDTLNNVIGIDYKHVQTYPPRPALIFVDKENNLSNYNLKCLIAAFKHNGTDVTYLNPKDGKLVDKLKFTVDDQEFEIKLPQGNLNTIVDTVIANSYSTVIKKPELTFDEANNLINGSNYETYEIFDGPHQFTDWEISDSSDFSNIVYSSYNDTTNLTSFPVTGLSSLTPGGTYYIRAKYGSDYHTSLWSDPVQFTAPYNHIITPTLSVQDNTYPMYPTFQLTPFEVFGYTDNWQSTDWQIATDPNFTNIVYSYTETDSTKQTILSITTDIFTPNTTYYVRARYNGDQGHTSDWSNVLEYNSGLYQLEYTIPSTVNEQTTLNIQTTHDNGKTFDTTQYVLKGNVSTGTLNISGMLAQWVLPSVDSDTVATITLWVEDLSGNQVTEQVTKSLTILNVTLVSDTAVSVTDSDFGTYTDYNDGWIITEDAV